jgi:hypothetical protein
MRIYCIEHEEMVETERNINKTIHTWTDSYGEMACGFELGYAFCPPPPSFFLGYPYEYYEAWEKWCEENDPETRVEILEEL